MGVINCECWRLIGDGRLRNYFGMRQHFTNMGVLRCSDSTFCTNIVHKTAVVFVCLFPTHPPSRNICFQFFSMRVSYESD